MIDMGPWPKRKRPKSTGRRSGRDILPKPKGPLIDAPMIEPHPPATGCRHGVPWDQACEQCERDAIVRWVDTANGGK